MRSLKKAARRKTTEALKTEFNHESFVSALDIEWTSTPWFDRGLRDLFLPVIAENKYTLLEKQDFVDIVRSDGDLAFDVLEYTWREPSNKLPSKLYCDNVTCQRLQKVRCHNCNQCEYLYPEKKA